MMRDCDDAYGHELYDCLMGKGGQEICERDDGYLGLSVNLPKGYFSEYKDWPPRQRKAMRFVQGRALDIGCGAGRVCLYLQKRGLDVVGVDLSPLAVRICKRRGVKDARVMSITRIGRDLGVFDTILMLGNNFGLFGGFKRARWLLKRFHRITSDDARIIAETRDPYVTTDPLHLAYHRRNRRRGRMCGQLRLRVRHGTYKTPWFDYLMVSKDEMKEILDGTGWRVERFIDSRDSAYVAVVVKEEEGQ